MPVRAIEAPHWRLKSISFRILFSLLLYCQSLKL